ncbi:uncharacterized protein TNCV_13721 [Trichonephila clavipes]|nr:uncharacterized protein TNCV_13721 [Trichonephila clavipes]
MPVFSADRDKGLLRSSMTFRITVLNPSIPYSANSHFRREQQYCDSINLNPGSLQCHLYQSHKRADDLRRKAEIRKRFQQLQIIAQKYAFLRPEVILSMDEFNLDQALQDINKEGFQLELVRQQAFVAATDPGCKTELIRSGSLGLLKYIIES